MWHITNIKRTMADCSISINSCLSEGALPVPYLSKSVCVIVKDSDTGVSVFQRVGGGGSVFFKRGQDCWASGWLGHFSSMVQYYVEKWKGHCAMHTSGNDGGGSPPI